MVLVCEVPEPKVTFWLPSRTRREPMNKNEQNRVVAWRLKLLRQASDMPTGRPWKRYEKPQPGHRVQVDVKFLERIAGSRKRPYQFTAIDDCTRIRVLKIYDACNQTSAIRFVDELIRRLPFRVLVIQTDNGGEFQSRFHWHLEEHDIRHVYIRPRTPHL